MARLKAGETLRKETRNALLQLKKLLSPTNLQYQIIADKLGLEILQCSIDYFNDSEEQDAARKAMSLQKYAESIVVGQMAKDRCKENIGILQEIIDNLPPSEVSAEDKAIHEELRKYSLLANKISHAVTLLNNVKLHLLAIKSKLGVSNKYYLNISTQVVENALSNVIAEVNEAQAVFKLDKNDPDAALAAILGVTRLKSVLSEAWEATKIMDEFDMEPDYKSNYNNNRSILMKLCNQLGVSTSTNTNTPIPPSPRLSPSPSGTTTRTTTSTSDNNSSSANTAGCIIGAIGGIGGLFVGASIGGVSGAISGTILGAFLGYAIGVVLANINI